MPDTRPPSTFPSAGRAGTAYDQRPMMVYWEVTQACDLACVHCRADAVPWRHPLELSTEEGFHLLEAIASFGDPKPHLVLTGGDPLKRPDLYWLIDRAVALGLTTSITPSATPLLTREAVARLQRSGVQTIALSLDGSSARRHDRIRRVPGSYERTIRAARWVREGGLSLQINSLVCAQTVRDLAGLYERVVRLDADRWSLFFLVPVGRGATLEPIDPFECEAVLEWLYDLALESPRPIIKTTEAHHFRRIVLQRRLEAAVLGAPARSSNGHAGALPDEAPAAIRRGFGIRDGAGIVFISHTGEVYPSGFLPLSAGNVRRDDLVRLYREAPLFRQLRDPSQLKGKCGRCEYRAVCGGSRARAWAATGDPLEADPLCLYQPRAVAAAAGH